MELIFIFGSILPLLLISSKAGIDSQSIPLFFAMMFAQFIVVGGTSLLLLGLGVATELQVIGGIGYAVIIDMVYKVVHSLNVYKKVPH